MNLLRQIAAVSLAGTLVVPSGVAQSFELAHASFFSGQAATPQPAATGAAQPRSSAKGPVVRKLRIVPLEGQGVTNIITTRSAAPLVVAVLDENDHPAEGVTVTFQLPASGAGGAFANQQTTYTAVTDARGQAGTLDFMPNDKPGRFEIRVIAKYQDLTANFNLRQANYFTPADQLKAEPKPLWRNWKVLAIVGGAALGGGIAAALLIGGGSTPVAVSAGPVSFVGPR